MNSSDVTGIFITFIVFGSITTIFLTWMKHRARPTVGSAELKVIADRLERMEQAIDAMAVETERISEGQRFTTKLLSERTPEPVRRP